MFLLFQHVYQSPISVNIVIARYNAKMIDDDVTCLTLTSFFLRSTLEVCQKKQLNLI